MAALGLRPATQALKSLRRDWPAAQAKMYSEIADELRGPAGRINSIYPVLAFTF
jgi:hypothetical protein